MTSSQPTGTTRRAGTTVGSGTETTGARRVYAYDNIGNRDTYTKGTGAQTTYESNPLNQYENVETASSPVTGQNLLYDADGNVTESYVVGDFDGDGSVGFSDLAIFSSSYGYCEGDPEFDERANLVTGDDPECIDSADQSAFMSLFGLSATSVMRAELLWDAENRLAAYIPLNQSGGAKKVTFKYDYRGRRIEKNVYAWNSGGSDWYTNWTERRRFVWNGWLMLRETIESDLNSDGDLADQDEGTRVKTYTWGKDLGGGLESAGGIGGLLAVYDDAMTSGSTGDDLAYVYMYDANGNVGQLCDLSQSTASASIVAKYEYDAYGNAPVSTGSYATANTYRFSTKPWDDETGLGYWGYRYYDPRLGRWMSRDPIGEAGGQNLYINDNDWVNRVDPYGLLSLAPKNVDDGPVVVDPRTGEPIPNAQCWVNRPCPTGNRNSETQLNHVLCAAAYGECPIGRHYKCNSAGGCQCIPDRNAAHCEWVYGKCPPGTYYIFEKGACACGGRPLPNAPAPPTVKTINWRGQSRRPSDAELVLATELGVQCCRLKQAKAQACIIKLTLCVGAVDKANGGPGGSLNDLWGCVEEACSK